MVFETIGAFVSKLMFFHGFVNEVNGFPDPLSKEDEAKYVEKMLNGDKTARELIIKHNLRLVVHVCKKFNGAAEADELISVGSIGLIKGIDSFKPEKGTQLSTYVSRCIENEILMMLRANKKHKQCVSIEESVGVDKDGSELTIMEILPQESEKDPDVMVEKKYNFEIIKDEMKKSLTDREYKILSLRYGITDGVEHTQREVAKMLGISRSYISRIETKALETLKERLEKDKNLTINSF